MSATIEAIGERDVVARIVEAIRSTRRRVRASRATLVAISGIDGAGKGWVATRVVEALRAAGLRAVGITVDGFLRLPPERFDAARPAERFYRRALRFEELFERLIDPLVRDRAVRVTVNHTDETADAYRSYTYDHEDVDVVVLEGIFLLRRDLRSRYDLAVWLECSFETALVRALRRRQEGLCPDDTIRAYRTTYFPAQYLHFALDGPRESADLVIDNDTLAPRHHPAARVHRADAEGCAVPPSFAHTGVAPLGSPGEPARGSHRDSLTRQSA